MFPRTNEPPTPPLRKKIQKKTLFWAKYPKKMRFFGYFAQFSVVAVPKTQNPGIARNPNPSRFRSHVWGCEEKCNHHGSHREVPQEIYRKWNISETNKSIWGILFPLGAATQGQVNQILATRQQTNTKCVDI